MAIYSGVSNDFKFESMRVMQEDPENIMREDC